MADPLSFRVLVLNRLWQAVHITIARRALALLSLGHARVLSPYEESWQVWPALEWITQSHRHPTANNDEFVQTVHHPIRVPKIIILNSYDRLPLKQAQLNRESILERDAYRCQYCGKTLPSKQLNLDHVYPRERGGRMSWENIVTSCIPCNSSKGNRTPSEAHMRLLRKPFQPKSRPFVSYIVGQQIQAEWAAFLRSKHEDSSVEIIGESKNPNHREQAMANA